MTISLLKNRWFSSVESKNSLKKIFDALKKGKKVKNEYSPFGKLKNGFSDFRGINFIKRDINNAIFEDSDLSYCNFDGTWIKDSSFSNVLFERAILTNISELGNTFKNVLFKNCNFKGSFIGYNGSFYENCIFENSNFITTGFIRGKFENCRILNCRLKNVDFYVTSFKNCFFRGLLEDTWFRGEYPYPSDIKEFGKATRNEMKNVSFEEAELIGVNFSNNCDLSTILLPNSGNYKLFDNWKQKLDNLKKDIEKWPEHLKKEANIMVDSFLIHANKQNCFILNIDEIENSFGTEISVRALNILN
ncbi:MAG: hypothetical protein HC831_29080 [Chloroflexia bacterium]|nr:hypothetical protein [Chloroflexia bacterium]